MLASIQPKRGSSNQRWTKIHTKGSGVEGGKQIESSHRLGDFEMVPLRAVSSALICVHAVRTALLGPMRIKWRRMTRSREFHEPPGALSRERWAFRCA